MTQSLPQRCQFQWNSFDPIGVSDWADDWDPHRDDEYQTYVGTTVKLLKSGADQHKLKAFVRNCGYVSMGCRQADDMDALIDAFVTALLSLRRS
jgi:hypothetical protein